MGELRDYQQWHHAYDDPDSGLYWRLTTVRRYLAEALDRHPGPVRVLSLCAGDGRDVIGALAGRPDAERVSATLVELHPGIAEDARRAARQVGLGNVEVRTADAGSSDNCLGAVPAHIVLLVGIFGNISNSDLRGPSRPPRSCVRPARHWSGPAVVTSRTSTTRCGLGSPASDSQSWTTPNSSPAIGLPWAACATTARRLRSSRLTGSSPSSGDG